MNENEFKLYVGNLEFGVNEEQLNNFFEEKGVPVQAVTIVKDKYTNRSRGFGFVTVASEEEINKAIELLNGQELNGRNLNVSKAKARTQRKDFSSRPRRNWRGGGGGGGPRRGGPRNY